MYIICSINSKSKFSIIQVKVSDTAGVAKKLTETVEVQISEDASQVMKVDAYECQDYEENDECKEVRLYYFNEI